MKNHQRSSIFKENTSKIVTTLVKNPCKYKNIRPQSWDTYSKLNGGKKILVGCQFGLLWLTKLEKALEMNEAFIGILFMKIIEIRRKGR